MRLIGIIAIFVLTVAAIVEGAVIVRLSSRLDSLDEKLALGSAAGGPADSPRQGGVALARGGDLDGTPALPPPRLAPAAAGGAPPTPQPLGPATAVLAEALQTPEGRQHLKGAMGLLREQDRQERLVRTAERDVEREQRYRDRLTKVLSLPPHDQQKVGQMFSALQAGRQKVLEEMRSGLKNAEQADDEIDNLEDGTEQQVRTLLGEQRMQQLRDAERAERAERRRGRGGGQGQGQPPGQQQGQQQQQQQQQQQAAPATPPPS